ncbi:hypothetical protein BS78_K148300 [Paspalum vaginatum]|uniref:Uncharacterized protein n=1 Tax=Paspalum vaginatum TaxID=158149 RepID=A0A9W7XC55_9POAL|nr:hypothetical protein BS78_K148300 [Paspalum vaginatum]
MLATHTVDEVRERVTRQRDPMVGSLHPAHELRGAVHVPTREGGGAAGQRGELRRRRSARRQTGPASAEPTVHASRTMNYYSASRLASDETLLCMHLRQPVPVPAQQSSRRSCTPAPGVHVPARRTTAAHPAGPCASPVPRSRCLPASPRAHAWPRPRALLAGRQCLARATRPPLAEAAHRPRRGPMPRPTACPGRAAAARSHLAHAAPPLLALLSARPRLAQAVQPPLAEAACRPRRGAQHAQAMRPRLAQPARVRKKRQEMKKCTCERLSSMG